MKTFFVVAAASLHVANISASPLSRRDATLCARKGYQTGTDSFITTSDGGYPACSSLCFSQSDCKSFAWSSTECDLYNVHIADNFQFGDDSPFFFYDRECETARQMCGVNGYQTTFDSYWWSNTISFSTCASTCNNDKGCKSYAYGNGECSLYAEPVAGNFAGVYASSPYVFYDVACPLPSSSATTTTTTVKTTNKSSTGISPSTTKTTSTTVRTTATTSSTISKKPSGITAATATTTPVKSTTKTSATVGPSISKTTNTTTKTAVTTSPTTTKASSTKTSSNTSKPTTSATKVTTKSTTTSTPASTSQTPSSTALCGLPGYENSPDFLTTSNGDSYNDCLADCKAYPNCKAFSFATSNNQCNLYDVSASQASRYNVISPYHFYDADCSTAYKVCGAPGWDFQFQAYWDGEGYTADSCAAACVADAACRSFAFGNGGECHMYFVPVTGNINQQPASPYSFSDVTCVTG